MHTRPTYGVRRMKLLLVLMLLPQARALGLDSLYNFKYFNYCLYSPLLQSRDVRANDVSSKLEAHLSNDDCQISGVVGQPLAFRMLPYAIQGSLDLL